MDGEVSQTFIVRYAFYKELCEPTREVNENGYVELISYVFLPVSNFDVLSRIFTIEKKLKNFHCRESWEVDGRKVSVSYVGIVNFEEVVDSCDTEFEVFSELYAEPKEKSYRYVMSDEELRRVLSSR